MTGLQMFCCHQVVWELLGRRVCGVHWVCVSAVLSCLCLRVYCPIVLVFACLLSCRASVGHANGLPIDVLLIQNYGNGHKTPKN